MKISDLKPDKRNPRKRTNRSSRIIRDSLTQFGAGRSIVIDRHGQIISGNGVIENANAAGITEIEVVESDGSKIIAVKRTDLDLDSDDKARQLSIADNRSAELAEWNLAELATFADLDLAPWFSESELSKLTAPETPEPGSNSHEIDVDGFEFAHTCPKCHFQFND